MAREQRRAIRRVVQLTGYVGLITQHSEARRTLNLARKQLDACDIMSTERALLDSIVLAITQLSCIEEPTIEAEICNISELGAGLICGTEFSVGTLLELKILANEMPIYLIGEVVFSSKHEHRYKLGLQFDHQPPSLRAFIWSLDRSDA